MRKSKLPLRLAAGALAAASCTSLALAADLPVKAPVLAPAVYNWTGIYGGVHAGYGGGMKDWGGINFLAHGALAGGTIGVNQQVGNWVIGVEGDGAWSGIKGFRFENIAIPFSVSNFDATIASKIDAVATIAARLGFAQDRWLVYVKAGGGWARETHTQTQRSTIAGVPGAQSVFIEGKENRFGPMVGFGAEYAFLGNWSGQGRIQLF